MSESSKEEKSEDPKDLLTIIERQKQEIKSLKTQLGEASDVLESIHEERDMRTEARRGELIFKLARDSDMPKDRLQLLPLEYLEEAYSVFDSVNREYLDEYIERRKEERRTGKRKDLTTGEWDPVKKEWKGGI